ncbi:MAG TPA: metallophosphoesterase [Chloroflexota bacterium]|nr:metallophosphoesterase [Chloroflexota bacterium]
MSRPELETERVRVPARPMPGERARPGREQRPGDPSRPPEIDTRDPAITVIARAIADHTLTRAGITLLKHVLPPPRVHLTQYQIAVPRLPRDLDGLRVLHLSDLHVHPGSDLAWQVPDLVAGVPHDLLCYTGDFIDVDDDIAPLATLLERLPRGAQTYAVLGNHDYIPFGRSRGANDVQRLRAVLAAAGITPLANEARPLYGGALYVVGVDDPASGRDDIEQAVAGVPMAAGEACTLVLAHSPDVALRLKAHRPSLILAGHTHGGQIRLSRIGPLLTLSDLPRHLAMGVGMYRGVPLFVNRGIGYSGLYIRIGSPAEVALLTLHSPHGRRAGG